MEGVEHVAGWRADVAAAPIDPQKMTQLEAVEIAFKAK